MSPGGPAGRTPPGPGEAAARALSAAGLDPAATAALVHRALDEDLGGHPGRDATSEASVPAVQVRTGAVLARADGVVAGLLLWPVVTEAAAGRLGLPSPEVELLVREGRPVRAGEVLAEVTGRTRVLLAAQRAALGLTSHLCGVATTTRTWVDAVTGTAAQVREAATTPGLRALERHAVRCGGGVNARQGLFDAAVVGPAHVLAAGSLPAALAAVRGSSPDLVVQVEVATADQAREALAAGARFLLCTAAAPPDLRGLVTAVREAATAAAPGEHVEVEACGVLDLAGAREVAAAGADLICVAALTRGTPPLDVTLELDGD